MNGLALLLVALQEDDLPSDLLENGEELLRDVLGDLLPRNLVELGLLVVLDGFDDGGGGFDLFNGGAGREGLVGAHDFLHGLYDLLGHYCHAMEVLELFGYGGLVRTKERLIIDLQRGKEEEGGGDGNGGGSKTGVLNLSVGYYNLYMAFLLD